MSQATILELIKKEPGVKQEEIHTKTDISKGCVSDQVRRLERWKEIRRVKTGFTYRLYPVEGT